MYVENHFNLLIPQFFGIATVFSALMRVKIDGSQEINAMRILFLDDDENRHNIFKTKAVGHEVTYVYNSTDAIKQLTDGAIFNVVYLDHDQRGEEREVKDGRKVTRWLSFNAARFPNTVFIMHSLNFAGNQAMTGILQGVGLKVVSVPFAWTQDPNQLIKRWQGEL